MATENESFEIKKRRSSILKQPDKRSRDSRTVSFNDKNFYKELYQDGTCDITNFFLGEDMDITMMDIVDPVNHTIDTSVDMSVDQTIVGSQSLDVTLVSRVNNNNNNTQATATHNHTVHHDATFDEKDMISVNVANQTDISQNSQISEISSLDDTLFGAFHDSMVSNRSSGVDTLVHNIEALNECIQRVDQEDGECRRRLDAEIQDLFNFYRHIVNKNDDYEFAIAIFGLRHSLWLIIKVNPETYPNEKLELRFAVNKKDRHLYPFKEYAEAVRRYTKEGSYGYLKRIVITAQRFRRFLKKIGYGKKTLNSQINHQE